MTGTRSVRETLATFAKIVLIFLAVGPPAGFLAWAWVNIVHGIATKSAYVADLVSLSLGALFLSALSYVFGGAQALLTGLAVGVHWAITKRVSYAWSVLYALVIFVLLSPLLSGPATWVSEPFALKPRALTKSIGALFSDPEKLLVWGAVHALAALAAVYFCREVLDDDPTR